MCEGIILRELTVVICALEGLEFEKMCGVAKFGVDLLWILRCCDLCPGDWSAIQILEILLLGTDDSIEIVLARPATFSLQPRQART